MPMTASEEGNNDSEEQNNNWRNIQIADKQTWVAWLVAFCNTTEYP